MNMKSLDVTSADLPPDARLYDIHFQAAPTPSSFGGAASTTITPRELGLKIEKLLQEAGLQPTTSQIGIMPNVRGTEVVNINAGSPIGLPPQNVPLFELVNAYKKLRARDELPDSKEGTDAQ